MTGQSYAHVSRIVPHPLNIREDLGDLAEFTASARAHGILQPIIVQAHPQRPGNYIVLAGHRRLAAAKRARLESVPITVRPPMGAAQALEVMLVENLQRRDLNPMEKAEAMGALRGHGYTTVQIAQRTGLTDATVSTYLALLDLDEKSRDRVRNRELPAAAAVAAVRKVRAAQRKQAGHKPHGAALTWEPDHFTRRHPLAGDAAATCTAAGHNLRRRLGDVACGQCWEAAIRADASTDALGPQPQTVRNGRIEDYLMLRREGLTRAQAAERLGVTERTICRYEETLADAPEA